MSGAQEPPEDLRPTIDERIAELRAENKSNSEIVIELYNEGYSTKAIMERRLPLKALKNVAKTDEAAMGVIAGTAKGAGYLAELKDMIRSQISRSRELTDVFYNVGLGALLASLHKSGMDVESFRKIALRREGLKEALHQAGETVFKALEYYETDLVVSVEGERDEARAYASYLEAKTEELIKKVDPRLRLERMIQTYLLSGGVDPDTLTTLLDKWLGMEMADIRLEMMR